MFLGFPWALSALAVLPVYLAVYFFQRRSRKVQVSALFLWPQPESNFSQGQRVERFRAPWLLLLELLILTLLILSVSDMRMQTVRATRATWLILDDSWSMQPFYQSARDELLERWQRLKSGYPVHLVFMGAQPRVLSGCTDFNSFRRELARWNPRQQTANRAAALQLAVQAGNVVREQSGIAPDYWLVSDHVDHVFMNQNPQIQYWSVGRPTDNAAWVQCVRSPAGAKQDCVRAELVNWSGSYRKLTVKADQFGNLGNVGLMPLSGSAAQQTKPIKSESLSVELKPGESTTLSLTVPADRALRWTLPNDAILYDNSVWSLPTPLRTIRTKVNVMREVDYLNICNALTLTQTGSVRVEISKHRGNGNDPDGPADLLITDGFGLNDSESISPAAWIVLFCRENSPATLTAEAGVSPPAQPLLATYSGPYLAKSCPLLTGTDFRSVLWTTEETSATLDQQMGRGEVLLSVRNTALISDELEPGGRRIIRFRLYLESSNLFGTPNWPIFVANLVSERVKSLPGLDKSAVALGDAVSIYGLSDQKRLSVAGWDSQGKAQTTIEVKPIQGRGVFRPTCAGLYRYEKLRTGADNPPSAEISTEITTDPASGDELPLNSGSCWVAVNPINAPESDVRACGAIKQAPPVSEQRLAKEYVPLQIPLLLAALALSAVHYCLSYRERSSFSSGLPLAKS